MGVVESSGLFVSREDMASKPLQLRCKTKTGQHYLTGLTLNSTIGRLKQLISEVTHIPKDHIKIRQGYPPKVIDTSNESQEMAVLPFQSGDTLIVEEDQSIECSQQKKVDHAIQSQLLTGNKGMLIRKIVPANNSCLFTSINAVMTDGTVDTSVSQSMRDLIAGIVMSDPETYNAGFLGKPNKSYCKWILHDESWGGGIEISILSNYYGIEIDVVDTQTGRIDRFGEDKNYSKRVMLIYDGIHYDPLVLEPVDPSESIEVRFATSDATVLAQALELAEEAKSSRQFTSISSFSLRCFICQKPLTGTGEAQEHAKSMGHINFGEY